MHLTVQKPLLKQNLIYQSMKTAIFLSIAVLCMLFLLSLSSAPAKGDSENDTGNEEINGADACILGSFCTIIIFVIFIIYLGAKRKSEESNGQRTQRQYHTPTSQHGYHGPVPHKVYSSGGRLPVPQQPKPQNRTVRCDLCESTNLRAFEDGYFKCNDCKHVLYIRNEHRYRR